MVRDLLEKEEVSARTRRSSRAKGNWRLIGRGLSATLLLGSNEFVARMKKLLKGDRREQTGLRKVGGETISWEAISATIGEVWGQIGERFI
jgi:hypothetical protein